MVQIIPRHANGPTDRVDAMKSAQSGDPWRPNRGVFDVMPAMDQTSHGTLGHAFALVASPSLQQTDVSVS